VPLITNRCLSFSSMIVSLPSGTTAPMGHSLIHFSTRFTDNIPKCGCTRTPGSNGSTRCRFISVINVRQFTHSCGEVRFPRGNLLCSTHRRVSGIGSALHMTSLRSICRQCTKISMSLVGFQILTRKVNVQLCSCKLILSCSVVFG
jgi:hypothetical protein